MRRTLILGNSHAAMLRRAATETGAMARGEVAFWGLPGGAFGKARTGADGILRPDPDDALSLQKLTEWNVAPQIDLAGFDRVFLVGLRFGLRAVLTLFQGVAAAELTARPGARLVSAAFLRAACAGMVRDSLAGHLARIPGDARFAVMAAPYPGLVTAMPGPLREAPMVAIRSHPDAATLLQLYEAEVAAAVTAAGMTFVPQPRLTLAAPFLTRVEHLADPAREGRHMDGAFGHLALQALDAALPDPLYLPRAMALAAPTA